MTYQPYQPKTGQPCTCAPGVNRDNCPNCEGTGEMIDFAAIRNGTREMAKGPTPNKPDQFYCEKCGCPVADVGAPCHCANDADCSPEGAAKRLLAFMGDPTKMDFAKIEATGPKLIQLCQDSGLTFTEQLYLLENATESLRETMQQYTHEIMAQAGIAIAEIQVSKTTGEIADIHLMDGTEIDPTKLAEIKARIKPQVDEAVARLLTRQTKTTSRPAEGSFRVSTPGKA